MLSNCGGPSSVENRIVQETLYWHNVTYYTNAVVALHVNGAHLRYIVLCTARQIYRDGDLAGWAEASEQPRSELFPSVLTQFYTTV